MKDCQIPFETLTDYREGRMNAETAAHIRQHLQSGCAKCQRDLDWLAAFLPTMQAALQEAEPQVSAHALANAFRLMQTRNPEPTLSSRVAQVARLLFDSRNPAAQMVPAREAAGSSIHVVYRVNKIDIDVWQETMREGRWYLAGQALPIEGGAALSLQQATLGFGQINPHNSVISALIEDGEFIFEAVAAGHYTLRLHWEDQEIIVPDLIVGSEELT